MILAERLLQYPVLLQYKEQINTLLEYILDQGLVIRPNPRFVVAGLIYFFGILVSGTNLKSTGDSKNVHIGNSEVTKFRRTHRLRQSDIATSFLCSGTKLRQYFRKITSSKELLVFYNQTLANTTEGLEQIELS